MSDALKNILIRVDHGDGAVGSIPNPRHELGLEWALRYGNPEQVRYVAASVIETFDYLVSDGITMKEATARLRQFRRARAEKIKEAGLGE
jgi:hypothetical protein